MSSYPTHIWHTSGRLQACNGRKPSQNLGGNLTSQGPRPSVLEDRGPVVVPKDLVVSTGQGPRTGQGARLDDMAGPTPPPWSVVDAALAQLIVLGSAARIESGLVASRWRCVVCGREGAICNLWYGRRV